MLEENKNCLLVRHIAPDTHTVTESLGITEERSEELQEISKKAFLGHDNIVSSMVEISAQIKHANELFYCSMLIVKNQDRQCNHGHPLDALFRDLLRRRGSRGDQD